MSWLPKNLLSRGLAMLLAATIGGVLTLTLIGRLESDRYRQRARYWPIREKAKRFSRHYHRLAKDAKELQAWKEPWDDKMPREYTLRLTSTGPNKAVYETTMPGNPVKNYIFKVVVPAARKGDKSPR